LKTSKLPSATWRKSSHSGDEGGNCIELADLDSAIGIRDSKNSDGPALVIRRREFGALLARVKSGELA
jgi:hypothetical protein